MTPFLWRKLRAKSQNRSSFFCVAAKVKHSPFYQFKETRSPLGGSRGFPRPKIVFLTCKNLCFCDGDAIVAENLRYRKFPAISTQPKTRSPKTRVGGDSQQPQFPQCHSPGRFLKKACVFVCLQIPESNPEAQCPGHPKRETKNTCWRRLPQPPSPLVPQCHSTARFLWQKAYAFACTRTPESKPEPHGPGPRLQGPGSRLQGSMGRSPRPQCPSSELQNLVPTAWAHASYQKFIKSEWAHCAQRRAIFWPLVTEQGRKANSFKHAPSSNS